ncbi:MAG: DUF2304 domain-containing protein [Chloroflexi bacterium]|nr:DUF2304 domain-containing protein [Chloroflexota bacterium]
MIDRVTVFGLVASAAVLIFVLELVRRRKLREDYSLLWLATAISLIVLALSRPLLDQIANFLGIVTYPPAALFLVAIMFMLVILLHYATVLTRLARENKQLAQKMAILQWELEQSRRGQGDPKPVSEEDIAPKEL